MCFCYLFVCTTAYRFLRLLHVYVFVVVFVARRVTLCVRSPIVFAAVGPLAAGCAFWQVKVWFQVRVGFDIYIYIYILFF